MTGRRERAEEVIERCPEWFHSIELAPGITTPGRKSAAAWQEDLAKIRLPDLHNKTVLDIGAYDGFFSFAAEQRGASRVVALDHYIWYANMVEYMKDWRESWKTGIPVPPPHASRHWRPAELPGRLPFDAAREVLESRVEPIVGDFMTMDLSSLGRFDVVLFLGVLYHLEEPLQAMRRLASVVAPGGLAVIETEAVEVPGLGHAAFCEFFPGSELNNDPSNWWAPNAKALEGLCKAAGFREATVIIEPPKPPAPPPPAPPARRGLKKRVRSAMKHLLYDPLPEPAVNNEPANTPLPRLRYRAIAHARL